MNEVFVDTSGWASFFIFSEPHHAKAVELMTQWQQQNGRVVTTNYVLSELVALFTSPLRVSRSTILDHIQAIRSRIWVEVIHIDLSLDEAAWKLFGDRLDKEWSLVDCASFVVMQQRGLTDALTTDHHFEQAGFVRLLK